jgi:hypothetical protein
MARLLIALVEVTQVELSESDVAVFRRDGYLLIESVFADHELDASRDAADRILELSINSTVALGRRHPRLDAKLHDDATVTVRKIQPINDLDPRLAAIADERLLGPLRQLMGDEPILMEEKLNPKQTLDTRHIDLSVLATSSTHPGPTMSRSLAPAWWPRDSSRSTIWCRSTCRPGR